MEAMKDPLISWRGLLRGRVEDCNGVVRFGDGKLV